jgi:general secretion pathway protein I
MIHFRQSGFSLLEAVVSMVLISGVGFALFGWINSNIVALNRIQETNARSYATQNVVEFIDGVNPMLKPEGTAAFGAYSIRWKAQPITAIQNGGGYYQLALYDTVVAVEKPEGTTWFDLHLRQAGFKRVRFPGDKDNL